MRPARLVLAYLIAVSFIGALLAPWLYWLIQGQAGRSSLFRYLADHSFSLFVNRALLLTAFAGLWPLLRALDLRSWQSVGLPRLAGNWRRVLAGIGLGFAMLLLIGGISIAVGARVFDRPGDIARKMPGIAWNAFVVALSEELLFRGVFFGSLRKAMAWPVALVLSSLLYAAVHFFTKVEPPPEITWTSGFAVVGGMFVRLVDPEIVVPGLFTLAVAGMIFGLAYQRSGNLYFSIGLHAGWVFWLKTYNVVTDPVRGFVPWLFGSNRIYDGWLILWVLAAIFVVAFRWRPPEPNGIESHAS